MRLVFWRNWPLATQLTLVMAALVAIAVAFITVLFVNREQVDARRELQKQSEVILTTLIATQANALYVLNIDSLKTAMRSLRDAQIGLVARVYDPDGRLLADSTQTQSLVFGVDIDPFGQELIENEALTIHWSPGYLELGQAITIGRQSIGAIGLQVPTSNLESASQAARELGLLLVAASVGIGIGISLLLSRTITRPLLRIASAAERISGGDLSTRVEITNQKEVGQLAMAFNEMIEIIQKRETDLLAQTASLRIATAKAKEAARVKGEFLANVSHELRTPLNAIIGFSDMLLAGMSGPLNDKQQHKLARLKENGARLLALINDLLDLTRIEAGRIEMVEKAFAPRALAERMAAQMESLAVESGLKFETVISSDVPALLLGDEKRVEQVIVNLLANAFKFTKQGSVSLHVEASHSEPTWVLSVADTGIGIPPHAVNLIFEEFRQLDGSYSRAYKGSGLGLAITRNLVRMMGGKISVKSEVAKGSTFTVVLPILTPETTQSAILEAVAV